MPRTDSTGDGRPTRWRFGFATAVTAVTAAAATLMGLAGCTATLGPTDGAVAQAARVSELESEVATLRVRLADATMALETARATDPAGDVEIAALVPRPDRVVEAGGSAVRPSKDDDGGRDGDAAGILQWRVRTEDARGRFVQTTGPAEVVAVTIDDAGEAVELGRWTIDAEAWRESLREGLLGTAYAIDLPVARIPADAQFLLARLVLEDIRLAAPLRLESPVPVIRPLPEARP